MKKYTLILLSLLLTGCSTVHERRSTTDSSIEYYSDFVTVENKLQIKLETRSDLASDVLILTVAVRDQAKHELASNVDLVLDGKIVPLAAIDQQTEFALDWCPHENPTYSENPAFSPYDPTTVSFRKYRLEFSLIRTLLDAEIVAVKVPLNDGSMQEKLWGEGNNTPEKKILATFHQRLLERNPGLLKE